MDTILDVLLLLAVALLGYLTGQRFPHLGGRISRWAGGHLATAARPPEPWRWRSRMLSLVAALAGTAFVWPIIQPGDPVADEMLEPSEVAVLVPLVLVFPVAWALLGLSRPYAWRIAVVLAAAVAGWSLWTVTFGSYDTPPNVDDGLRWYLVGTGVIVASASVVESRRRGFRQQVSVRGAVGVLVWMIGVAAVFAVPVVGGARVPPPDAVLPLPPTMTIVHEEAGCAMPIQFGPLTCRRRFTVAATDGADVRQLARALGEHLERTKGWSAKWYDTSTAHFSCRRIGWLNPYELCVELRRDESLSTVWLQLAYYNGRDQVVY